MIPTLMTTRLILRPLRPEDWVAYRDFLASERARYVGGPFALKMAWGIFCADHAQWDFYGCGALMIEERNTSACLGQVGINFGPLFPEWELGWLLYSGAEGKGYAFEAASALRDWARQERQLSTLVSYIDPQNERSRRLAERLGATLDEQAPKLDPIDLVYRYFKS
ncbi:MULTISPECIES: GNAT family N-acetyltransferase [unclassified Beijerinckia]|uniref:GNAT family N-acetyltransferase n=1 Tax=unclassified Beijerinckia TaxID=2638183 RepID=UPI000899F0D1|nr:MULTISPECIES: GNAT family N-acetyltransferase [unclassified Beijerinckia]MDH7798331.1 RimJ/RimL family protein N-acetyltransferase [Beijerinckia sp. GAS462]SED17394.1 Protein N-acetyltransferase, RimJ/RimL family [Beijerinckia sp. 28-YEA-48]